MQAESHPTPATLEAIGHGNRTSVIGAEALVALGLLMGAVTMKINHVTGDSVESDHAALDLSAATDEKIEALPSTRIHSGPFRIEGMEEKISFLDDGLSVLINGHIFTLHEISVSGLHYDAASIRDMIGVQGITGINCNEGMTFEAGGNSLKITQGDFAGVAKHLRDSQGPIATEQALPYELKIAGMLGFILPKNGTCTLTLRRGSKAVVAPGIAKTH